jgi:hypothetical protein
MTVVQLLFFALLVAGSVWMVMDARPRRPDAGIGIAGALIFGRYVIMLLSRLRRLTFEVQHPLI